MALAYLKNVKTGVIHGFNEVLAKRTEMTPCDQYGNEPQREQPKRQEGFDWADSTDRPALAAFALKEFGVKLDSRLPAASLRGKIGSLFAERREKDLADKLVDEVSAERKEADDLIKQYDATNQGV